MWPIWLLQLFFHQSNVVDKRTTPRWLNHVRNAAKASAAAVAAFEGIDHEQVTAIDNTPCPAPNARGCATPTGSNGDRLEARWPTET